MDAIERISEAITVKLLPFSFALAASIAAFSASKEVFFASLVMRFTASVIFFEASYKFSPLFATFMADSAVFLIPILESFMFSEATVNNSSNFFAIKITSSASFSKNLEFCFISTTALKLSSAAPALSSAAAAICSIVPFSSSIAASPSCVFESKLLDI